MTFQPRIAIVGGGPGGLSVAMMLHKNNIPFTVFELRQKPTEEELSFLSGMLDLHEDSGLALLKAVDLLEEFLPLTGECSQSTIVADRNGQALHASGGGANRPEISRNNLTTLFLRHLPPDCLRWGYKLVSASAGSSPGETILDFGHEHGKLVFDVVIGADGAWSRVRPLLTDIRPTYSGMQIVTITIKNISTDYPHLSTMVGSGTYMAFGDHHAVVSQRGPSDSARIYLWLTRLDEDYWESSGIASGTAADAKVLLVTEKCLYGGFGPRVKELITVACERETADNNNHIEGSLIDTRPLYSLLLPESGLVWKHVPGVTLIGDAAHLQPPNGEGVNAAMLDAKILAEKIIEACKSEDKGSSFQSVFDPKLLSYEEGMSSRSQEESRETADMMKRMFGSDNAGKDMVDFFYLMSEMMAAQKKKQEGK